MTRGRKVSSSPDAGSHKIEGSAAAALHIVADSIVLLSVQHCASILQWAVTGVQFYVTLPFQFHEFLEKLVILAVGDAAVLLHLCRQLTTGEANKILFFRPYHSGLSIKLHLDNGPIEVIVAVQFLVLLYFRLAVG